MTIAGKWLAVIAAVTLPITARSSLLGMNLIINHQTTGYCSPSAAFAP
jgi:magnesium transporter